jgi:hypothetical protein
VRSRWISRKARISLPVIVLLVFSIASLARAEIVQHGTLRVTFDGKLTPHVLPRQKSAPVRVAVSTKIDSTKSTAAPPQLRQISIAINRYGQFNREGVPICTLRDIQPSTTAKALETCGDSLVGQGHFSARVLLGQQSPFPSAGKMYAFNGSVHGKPAILAHIYGTQPVPTSLTLPFMVQSKKGTFGTVLRADIPEATGGSGYVTGIALNLGRTFRMGGKAHGYLSASCPAPKGFMGAVFPFAKARVDFGKKTITSTLTRSCKVER